MNSSIPSVLRLLVHNILNLPLMYSDCRTSVPSLPLGIHDRRRVPRRAIPVISLLVVRFVFVMEVVMYMQVETLKVVLAGDYSFGIEAEAYANPRGVKKDCSSRWLP